MGVLEDSWGLAERWVAEKKDGCESIEWVAKKRMGS